MLKKKKREGNNKILRLQKKAIKFCKKGRDVHNVKNWKAQTLLGLNAHRKFRIKMQKNKKNHSNELESSLRKYLSHYLTKMHDIKGFSKKSIISKVVFL